MAQVRADPSLHLRVVLVLPVLVDDPREFPEDLGVDDLGHVGEVVEREANRLGLEVRELVPVVVVAEDLQIERPDIVSSRAHGSRYRGV